MTYEKLNPAEIEASNQLFVWLQQTNEHEPPNVNAIAEERLELDLLADPAILPRIREILHDQPTEHQLPLRLYIAGFSDDVLFQLDTEQVLEEAKTTFTERCKALGLLERADVIAPQTEATTSEEEPPRSILVSEQAKQEAALLTWLQSSQPQVPEILGELAEERIRTDFEIDPNDLPVLRMLVNQLDSASRKLVQMYIAGSDETAIRQLDDKRLLNTTVLQLSKVCQEVVQANTELFKVEVEDDTEDSLDTEQLEKLQLVPFTADMVKTWLKEIGKAPLLKAEQEVALGKAIEVGLFAQERLDTMEHSLTPDEQDELEQIARIGEQAKTTMLVSNLRLVAWLAKRYTGRGLEYLDLIQEGNLGLIRAVEKYDYTKGYKFSTYATWWVRQAVNRALHDSGRVVRLPVHIHEKIKSVEKFKAHHLRTTGQEASLSDIAEELEVAEDVIVKLLLQQRSVASLNMPIGDEDGAELMDIIADDKSENSTVDEAIAYELPDAINHVLRGMKEQEQTVLRLRLGLDNGRELSVKEVGDMLGIPHTTVRHIEAKAFSKLRHPSRSYHLTSLRKP